MCISNESIKKIYVQYLEPILTASLPFLIALYFGYPNVYKIHRIMIIGYILLFIVYCIYLYLNWYITCFYRDMMNERNQKT